MKRTFITQMPDEAGAFLKASRIARENDCNIIRVSYNKSVDLHTLFIDATGTEQNLENMENALFQIGYRFEGAVTAQVLLIEFMLENKPGAAEEILELISELKINISYINSQANGLVKYFKAGLFIDNPLTIKTLLDRASKICEVKILDYDTTETLLDSAIFYVSFTSDIRNILKLTQEETNIIMANSNEIMQHLDARGELPHKTFDYIKKYAQFISHYKGESFFMSYKAIDLLGGVKLHQFAPPCGSNIYALEKGDSVTFIDSGFACYKEEIRRELKTVFPNFDSMKKDLWLTHADIDHSGNLDFFDNVYMSRATRENFELENAGKENYREQHYIHAPYARLSAVISQYKTPSFANMQTVDTKAEYFHDCMTTIGEISFENLTFDVILGTGGHVRGETIFVCREMGLIFSGDNYVNIRGFSKEQANFNKLAPFLMSSVNMDSKSATVIRNKISHMAVERPTLLCPAHGDWLETF
ncbi:MAG: MBL fold metallo-hydrolase [Bacillota bacterium]